MPLWEKFLFGVAVILFFSIPFAIVFGSCSGEELDEQGSVISDIESGDELLAEATYIGLKIRIEAWQSDNEDSQCKYGTCLYTEDVFGVSSEPERLLHGQTAEHAQIFGLLNDQPLFCLWNKGVRTWYLESEDFIDVSEAFMARDLIYVVRADGIMTVLNSCLGSPEDSLLFAHDYGSSFTFYGDRINEWVFENSGGNSRQIECMNLSAERVMDEKAAIRGYDIICDGGGWFLDPGAPILP